MQIDWAILGVVAVVAAAAAVTVVLLVAFALVGLSTSGERRVGSVGITFRTRGIGTPLAALFLLAAGFNVGYGAVPDHSTRRASPAARPGRDALTSAFVLAGAAALASASSAAGVR